MKRLRWPPLEARPVPATDPRRRASRELNIESPDGSNKFVPLGVRTRHPGTDRGERPLFSRRPRTLPPAPLIRTEQWRVAGSDLGSRNGTYVNGQQIVGPAAASGRPRRRGAPGDRVPHGRRRPGTHRHFVDPGPPGHATTIETDLAGALVEPAVATPFKAQGTSPTQALIRAGQGLAGHMTLDQLFPEVLNLSIEAVGAARGVLMTLEGDELVPQAATGGDSRSAP